MKLSQYANKLGVSYRTAWSYFKAGLIAGAYKTDTGTIIVPVESAPADRVVVYARVSSSENKANLDSQAQRVSDFCAAKGWVVAEVVKEVGSGLNDNRVKLNKILSSGHPTKLVVEHKDRLTRFGFNYIETLLHRIGCEVVVINLSTDDKTDLIQDFISVITSFCARIYGQRRSKRKTEVLIETLKADAKAE